MTRRKFARLAGSAMLLAGLPLAERIARAAASEQNWGGITPNSDFYVTSYKDTPRVDANLWRLKITGLIDNPIELSYAQILKLPPIKERLTLECIGNPPGGDSIGNADWTAVKLKPLLDRARVKPGATHAAMRGADGYYTAVPVDEIMRGENFLPYLMNGDPLPPDHGYPLRIFIPGKYGMKQPKWITEIRFVDYDFTGYWEKSGWSNSAWRKPNSGFFSPRPHRSLLSPFSAAAEINGPIELLG
jgi:DMSO/TMAO reductase YedYZ molybdopterin-dependent catalytic subunit